MNIKTVIRFFRAIAFFMLGGIVITGCELDGDLDYQTNTQYDKVKLYFWNFYDTTNYYQVDYNSYTLEDSLTGGAEGFQYLAYYLDEERLSGNLQVYKLGTEQNILLYDTLLSLNGGDTLQLYQKNIGEDLVVYNPTLPTDSNQVNIQLVFNGASQPDQVILYIRAVDYYTFLVNGSKLNKVPDSLKLVIDTITLSRNEISSPITFDLDYYAPNNHNVAALFLYQVCDPATGDTLQDYSASKSVIDIESTDGSVYPVYRACVMEFGYSSDVYPLYNAEVLSAYSGSVSLGVKW